MIGVSNAGLGVIVKELTQVIVANRAYLSDIDGKTGDGDHGNNMAKGFSRAAERIDDFDTLDVGLNKLSEVLMGEIGGSMGPLYGMMFSDMAGALSGKAELDRASFGEMLRAGLEGVVGISAARVGDKTLLDTLTPAVAAFEDAPGDFLSALAAMVKAAEAGRDSTINLVAKVGRASRLGERSRGFLDAGATSCCLILGALAESVGRRLDVSCELP